MVKSRLQNLYVKWTSGHCVWYTSVWKEALAAETWTIILKNQSFENIILAVHSYGVKSLFTFWVLFKGWMSSLNNKWCDRYTAEEIYLRILSVIIKNVHLPLNSLLLPQKNPRKFFEFVHQSNIESNIYLASLHNAQKFQKFVKAGENKKWLITFFRNCIFIFYFRYGHFSGINRKVQLKYQPKGRPRNSSSDEGNIGNFECFR